MSRRNSVSEYKFADVVVDTANFRVRRADAPQKITPRAFEVLLYLIEQRGRTVEKQEIFEAVWREQFVSDNALTRIVKEIRQVTGDAANAPRFIETVPKRGYRFIAEVEETTSEKEISAAVSDPGAEVEFHDSSKPPVQAPPAKRLFLVAAVLLFGAALVFGSWLFYRNQSPPISPPVAARTAQITRGPGLDNFPAISPDGNLLAYSSDRSGGFEIYVKPLASDKEIQLTADGNQNFQPAFSPDGQRIAYHSKTRGGIWIIPAAGGMAKQLTSFGTNPAWSPDGRQIAFQTGALTSVNAFSRTLPPSVLWLVASDGGEPRQLTRAGEPVGGHSAPAWSPDGRRIAFNVEDFSSFAVWSVNLADGKLQEITASGFDAVYAADGKRIYYVSLNGLWQLPISADDQPAGEATKLSDDGPAQIRHIKISADGKKMVYGMLQSKSSIGAVAFNEKPGAANGSPALLVENSAPRNTFPAFTPDGSRFAFVIWQPGALGALWLANADGKNAAEIAQNATIPTWFPDGKRIAFLSTRDGVTRVWAIDISTGRETPLFTFETDVDFMKLAPDGKQIAYNSKAGGAINVWLANLETGEQRQVTFHEEFMGFPIWSPDGKTLAVQIKQGEDTHVALVSLASGEIEQLTAERGQSWIHSFSPDGERIAFAGQRDDIWNVYTVSRRTKEQKKLTGYNRLSTYVRYPAWSPRNDQIVFEYAETTGNIWLTELK